MKKTLLSAIAASILSGCASTSVEVTHFIPKQYLDSNTNSKALVLTNAVGISGLKDQSDNQHIVKDESIESTALDNILSLSSSGGANLATPEALVIGSTLAVLTTDDSAKKDKIFAWAPTTQYSSPEEAQKGLSNEIIKAFQRTAESNGFAVEFSENNEEDFFGYLSSKGHLIKPDIGCVKRECYFYINITKATNKSLQPPKVDNLTEGYLFTAKHVSSKYKIDLPNRSDTTSFLKDMSSNLPNWIYFYRAPTEKSAPFLINNGDELRFSKPRSSSI